MSTSIAAIVQVLLQIADRRDRAPEPNAVARGRVRGPVPSDPTPTFPEHMFPSLTTRRDRPRPLRELVRGALGTALEFATLGEATLGSARPDAPAPPSARRRPAGPTAPIAAHPHRRRLTRQQRARRTGMVPARTQACRQPVHRPAAPTGLRPAAPGLGGRERRRPGAPSPGAPDFIASRAARSAGGPSASGAVGRARSAGGPSRGSLGRRSATARLSAAAAPRVATPPAAEPPDRRLAATNANEPPNGRLVKKEPAATYSPRPLRAKYHRRCGA